MFKIIALLSCLLFATPAWAAFAYTDVTPVGAICDGDSHPLSSVYGVGPGALAAAQADFPNATSLTNELDAVAINAAAAVVRTRQGVDLSLGVNFVLPSGACQANISIDFTMLRGVSTTIVANGTKIYTTALGKVAVDAIGSQHLKITGSLQVISIFSAFAPKVGLQIGRWEDGQAVDGLGSSDQILIEGVYVSGYYSQTALLDLAAEQSVFIKSAFQNQWGAFGYACAFDGMNHFHATSDYVTVILTINTASSMTNTSSMGLECRNPGGGPALFLAAVQGANFISPYLYSSGGTHIVEVYSSEAGQDSRDIRFIKGHVETNTVDHVFKFTGGNPTPRFVGLVYEDESVLIKSGGTVFAADTQAPNIVTQVYLKDASVKYANTFYGNIMPWDNPALYTVSGDFMVPRVSQWAEPNVWLDGTVHFADTTTTIQTGSRGRSMLISAKGTNQTHTGNTTETAVKSVRIPAYGSRDGFRIRAVFTRGGVPTNKVDFGIRVHTASCTVGAPCITGTLMHDGVANSASLITEKVEVELFDDGAGHLVYVDKWQTGLVAGWSNIAPKSVTMSLVNGIYLNFTCKLLVATDTCNLKYVIVEAIPAKG